MKRISSFFLLFFFIFLFVSCASKRNWVREHPGASQIENNSKIGILPSGPQLLIRSSESLVQKTGLPTWQLYKNISKQLDSVLLNQCNLFFSSQGKSISCVNYGQKSSDSLAWKGSIQLDKKTFIPVHWPAQNDTSLQNAPKSLLIIHEIHIGFNLNRESILENKSTADLQRAPTQPSFDFVAIYTLWDSKRNEWSKVGAIKTSLPDPGAQISSNDFKQLIEQGSLQIFKKLVNFHE